MALGRWLAWLVPSNRRFQGNYLLSLNATRTHCISSQNCKNLILTLEFVPFVESDLRSVVSRGFRTGSCLMDENEDTQSSPSVQASFWLYPRFSWLSMSRSVSLKAEGHTRWRRRIRFSPNIHVACQDAGSRPFQTNTEFQNGQLEAGLIKGINYRMLRKNAIEGACLGVVRNHQFRKLKIVWKSGCTIKIRRGGASK